MISILPAQPSKLGIQIANETTKKVIFAKFLSIEAYVNMKAEVMRHVEETGSTFVDSKIIHPYQVEITGFLSTILDLQSMASILADRSHYFTVTVNGTPWSNMVASDVSLDNSADAMDTYPVQLVFNQVLCRKIDYTRMAQATDYPNRKFGDQGLGNVSATVQQLFDKIRSMF